jgi:nitroreductase
MTSFLANLGASFGTKSFDSELRIPEVDIKKIFSAIRATPTSFGLQPFHVIDVRDPAIRESMKGNAMNQAQVTTASHLLVFCARTDIDTRIDRYAEEASGGDPKKRETLDAYTKKVRAITGGYDQTKALEWTTKQTYIALGFALAAAAELGIDSCPLEGFNKLAIAKLLELPEEVRPVLLLALGYKKDPSPHKHLRFPESDLFSVR